MNTQWADLAQAMMGSALRPSLIHFLCTAIFRRRDILSLQISSGWVDLRYIGRQLESYCAGGPTLVEVELGCGNYIDPLSKLDCCLVQSPTVVRQQKMLQNNWVIITTPGTPILSLLSWFHSPQYILYSVKRLRQSANNCGDLWPNQSPSLEIN